MPSPSDASEKKHSSRRDAATGKSCVFVLDLETLVKNRRPALKKALGTRFSHADAAAAGRMFYRLGLAGSPTQIAKQYARALEADPSPADAVLSDMQTFYADGAAEAADGASKLMDRPEPIVLITWLSEDAARALLRKLGLDRSEGLHIVSAPQTKLRFPDSSLWTAAAQLEPARSALAIVDNEFACREALSAGLSCLGAPDEWTSFQDFGGVCQMVENLGDVGPAADLFREG